LLDAASTRPRLHAARAHRTCRNRVTHPAWITAKHAIALTKGLPGHANTTRAAGPDPPDRRAAADGRTADRRGSGHWQAAASGGAARDRTGTAVRGSAVRSPAVRSSSEISESWLAGSHLSGRQIAASPASREHGKPHAAQQGPSSNFQRRHLLTPSRIELSYTQTRQQPHYISGAPRR
jgi:hypothetical protein